MKEAIDIKQRIPSLNTDGDLGLPAIYNPLRLGIRNNLLLRNLTLHR